MIAKTVNKQNTMVTYATIIKIDGRYVRLFYSVLLGYLKSGMDESPITRLIKKDAYESDFAKCFLWSLEAYTDPTRGHQMYNWIRETNYSHLTGKWHELQWDEVKVEDRGHYIVLSDSKNSHMVAVPPSSTLRYDYITADGRYRYGCAKGEFDGIEITVGNK